ncbi:hypothetical protein CB0940_02219 [Cercospora beticola]|uniref:Uncharacterized protein n=1 Tax=Cercospora beticola TaxID=122368 RepID=A0A2G5I9I5_CERBT|nr:hypothetical protein CB0940_02219 [Cercospora beticola]PIB01420.1 hypothetical protein CB0940_02219 [Cercospora beticola]WPA97626.1 hypothetical protein RHO25_002236 [Cercospora beticola]
MKFSHALTALALASGVVADCPPEQRIDALKYIVRAFNAVGLESVQLINGMPLAPQCDAFLFINGLPGISPAFDSTTVKAFSQTVRQAFGYVEGRYSAADNGTATLDAIVTLGVLQVLQAPVRTRIVVPAEFDPETCLITSLPTYIMLPTDIAGNTINPPRIPKILGIDRLPGFKPILQLLVPAIGDIFNVLN